MNTQAEIVANAILLPILQPNISEFCWSQPVVRRVHLRNLVDHDRCYRYLYCINNPLTILTCRAIDSLKARIKSDVKAHTLFCSFLLRFASDIDEVGVLRRELMVPVLAISWRL